MRATFNRTLTGTLNRTCTEQSACQPCVSKRHFAKAGITRPRRRRRRDAKPFKERLPRKGDRELINISKTRTLTATPWGPPRAPVPRVEESSTEFFQNVHSLCEVVRPKLQCLGLAVATVSRSSKAALLRLEKYSDFISNQVPYIHLYQLVLVSDVLGYSRDYGSRNTLWIPEDFTVQELISFLKEQCMADPKLAPLRRIDQFLNPFQPVNWKQVDNLHNLDGSSIARNRPYPIPENEYHNVEPLELLRIREKGRNAIMDGERYVDASDYFRYWTVPRPDTDEDLPKDGRSDEVPPYKVPFESTASVMDGMENSDSHSRQIDAMELRLEEKLADQTERILEDVDLSHTDLLSVDFDEKSPRFTKERFIPLEQGKDYDSSSSSKD